MITNSLSKTEKELSIKPYYTDSHCTIYQGDCLDIMAIFPDESIDLIITDPPYNISHKDKLYRTYKNGKRKDISLDFGECDYGFDATLFLEESKRVLKKYGQWLIFCSDLQLGDYVEWLKKNFDSDVILDPFMGSGTTLVAGEMLGRKVIGIEINDRYCKISTERLKQEILF